MRVRIGSRGSDLALAQAREIAEKLNAIHSPLEIEIIRIKTTGDKMLDSPLSKIGEKGLFVKEIEIALQAKEIDLAVHSAKDLPSAIPDDLMIAATPPREDPRDILVTGENLSWGDLPPGAVIGTSALRRQSQILFHRPDMEVKMLRGNVDTRLRKLDKGEYFGIVLAQAGLNRLGIKRGCPIPENILVPAPGQGALALEMRKGEEKLFQIVKKLNDESTSFCVAAERSLLAAMEGGCQVPMGGHAALFSNTGLVLDGFVASPDGKIMIRDQCSGRIDSGKEIGERLARILLKKGGKEILQILSLDRD